MLHTVAHRLLYLNRTIVELRHFRNCEKYVSHFYLNRTIVELRRNYLTTQIFVFLNLNRTIVELRLFIDSNPHKYFTYLNRTIVELRQVEPSEIFTVLLSFESNHCGIETFTKLSIFLDVE